LLKDTINRIGLLLAHAGFGGVQMAKHHFRFTLVFFLFHNKFGSRLGLKGLGGLNGCVLRRLGHDGDGMRRPAGEWKRKRRREALGFGRGRRTGVFEWGERRRRAGGSGEVKGEVKGQRSTLAQLAAAGVRHRAGAQRVP
jgi:hypothetical protein